MSQQAGGGSAQHAGAAAAAPSADPAAAAPGPALDSAVDPAAGPAAGPAVDPAVGPAAGPAARAAVQEPAPPARPRPSREVHALGRSWPRAVAFERVFWLVGGLAAVVVLGLSLWLTPDARGIGTHEQLGLPPCGFVVMFDGVPCPSCGFTTTFTLAAHGRPLAAAHNQPFGFALFLLTLAAAPTTLWAAARGVSLFEATERWPWGRIFCGFLGLWLLAWGYKWLVLMR